MDNEHLELLESLGKLTSFTPGRIEIRLANYYSVSILYGGIGYSSEGTYELAVINPDSKLDYTTPVTDDVLAYRTIEEVEAAIKLLLETYPAGEL